MLKPVIAATAVLALAGSSLVYAQQRFEGRGSFGDDGFRAERQHHRFNADDIKAFADARIAALKAGLELTPDQAKNWPPFEAALHNMVQLRTQRRQDRESGQAQTQSAEQDRQQPQGQQMQGQSSDQGRPQQQDMSGPFARLARRADAMSAMGNALKQVADTGAPLYQSLNDQQKSRFTMLVRMLRPRYGAFDRGGWREGRRYERGGADNQDRGGRRRRFGMEQDGPQWNPGDRRFDQGDGRWDGGGPHHRTDGGYGFDNHNLTRNGDDQDSDSHL